MLQPRLIPVLLLQDNGLVKTVRFKNPSYIGDPMNAVKIFNEKGADELLLVNLDASMHGAPMDTKRLADIASEAFMPVSYGGGISRLDHIEQTVKCGIEKVVINSAAVERPDFVSEAVKEFGGSTISVSVDYKTNWRGASVVCSRRGTRKSNYDVLTFCKDMEQRGAGEILLHNVDRDGTMKGLDHALVSRVCAAVNVPVVACGGASSYGDAFKTWARGASGVAAGSLFVYDGVRKAVLIHYPDEKQRPDFNTPVRGL